MASMEEYVNGRIDRSGTTPEEEKAYNDQAGTVETIEDQQEKEAEVEENDIDDQDVDSEDESDDEDEDESDDEDDDEPEVTVESLKTEVERLTAALDKANKEKMRLKRRKTELEEAAGKAETEESNRWKTVAVNKAVDAALKDAGLQGSPARVKKFMDLTEVDMDDSGEIVGYADAIDALKDEYPEFFEVKAVTGEAKPERKVANTKVDGNTKMNVKPPVDPIKERYRKAGII